jgi:predicted dehydrogenase
MCRKKARIVLVGTSGLNIKRDDFFEKEISFMVSCSYGPGRYDKSYEEEGIDYPYGYVRWTEQRNFEAVLDMMAANSIDIKPLITDRYGVNDAVEAYGQLSNQESMGILLSYNENDILPDVIQSNVTLSEFSAENSKNKCTPRLGFLGSGNYASRVLIPAFKKTEAILDTLVSSGGLSSVHHGKKHGFRCASTSINDVLANNDIDTVIITTRHDKHAEQIMAAIKARKNIFVEKPLALTLEELNEIERYFREINSSQGTKIKLMIGFNRRFSPHLTKIKKLLEPVIRGNKSIIMTINAGSLPEDHWLQDLKIGGGRVIGEVCHFIDLMSFIMSSKVKSHQVQLMQSSSQLSFQNRSITIGLNFDDGSFGTIHYIVNGGKAFPKERIEVFSNDGALQMDNYKSLKGYNWPGFSKFKTFSQNKGQVECVSLFVKAIKNNDCSPISFDEIMDNSKLAIKISDSLTQKLNQ